MQHQRADPRDRSNRGKAMAFVNALAVPSAPSGHRFRAAIVGVFALTATLLPVDAWARSAPESFADLAEEIMPAVVNISASTTVEARGRALPQLPPGTPFEDLFEEFFNRRGQGGQGGQPGRQGGRPRQRGADPPGSGVGTR